MNFVFAATEQPSRRKPVHRFQLYSAGMVGTCGLRLEKEKAFFEVSQLNAETAQVHSASRVIDQSCTQHGKYVMILKDNSQA